MTQVLRDTHPATIPLPGDPPERHVPLTEMGAELARLTDRVRLLERRAEQNHDAFTETLEAIGRELRVNGCGPCSECGTTGIEDDVGTSRVDDGCSQCFGVGAAIGDAAYYRAMWRLAASEVARLEGSNSALKDSNAELREILIGGAA